MYYRGAQAAIVVYDITNADTFTRAKSWVGELHRQARPDIVIALGMLRFLYLPGSFSCSLYICKFYNKVQQACRKVLNVGGAIALTPAKSWEAK